MRVSGFGSKVLFWGGTYFFVVMGSLLCQFRHTVPFFCSAVFYCAGFCTALFLVRMHGFRVSCLGSQGLEFKNYVLLLWTITLMSPLARWMIAGNA